MHFFFPDKTFPGQDLLMIHHEFCRLGQKTKKGKLNTSHRYNRLPLLPSGPGGVQQELVVYDLPRCKVKQFSGIAKKFRSRSENFQEFSLSRLSKIRGNMESTDGNT